MSENVTLDLSDLDKICARTSGVPAETTRHRMSSNVEMSAQLSEIEEYASYLLVSHPLRRYSCVCPCDIHPCQRIVVILLSNCKIIVN